MTKWDNLITRTVHDKQLVSDLTDVVDIGEVVLLKFHIRIQHCME
jgi:hypothetical protein